MIEFKRGQSETTDCDCCADWMRWQSRCGNYMVAKATDSNPPEVRFYAHTRDKRENWTFIEYHQKHGKHSPRSYRNRAAAERACTQHQKEDR